MITLHGNDNKIIQLSLGNTIHEFIDDNICLIEMPVVICNNQKDAKRIQQEINAFANEISKKILAER